MAGVSSVSIKVGQNEDASPELASLEKEFGSRLDRLDVDGDGRIDRIELLMFVRDVVHRERKTKYLKGAVIGLVALLVLFALTTFGTVWAVVALTQKVETGGGASSGLGVALVSSSDGETLRTAPGAVQLDPVVYNATAAQTVYGNADGQTRRRLLMLGTDQTYVGDLAPKDAIAGCELLLEGHRDLVTFLPINGTGEGGTSEGEEVMNVQVLEASLSACRKAVKNGDVMDLQAVIAVAGYSSNMLVYCPTSTSCQIFNATTNPDSVESDNSRRRLLGGGTNAGEVSLHFGWMGSLVCSSEECTAQESSSGRHLLYVYICDLQYKILSFHSMIACWDVLEGTGDEVSC